VKFAREPHPFFPGGKVLEALDLARSVPAKHQGRGKE
jgi:hypothetical protein